MDDDRYCPEHGRNLHYATTPKDQLLFDIARVLRAMDHYEDAQGAGRGHVYEAEVVFALDELKDRYEIVRAECPDNLGIRKEGE